MPQHPLLERLDSNLQVIKAIESSWEFPQLPDMVKLDLASQDISAQQLELVLAVKAR